MYFICRLRIGICFLPLVGIHSPWFRIAQTSFLKWIKHRNNWICAVYLWPKAKFSNLVECLTGRISVECIRSWISIFMVTATCTGQNAALVFLNAEDSPCDLMRLYQCIYRVFYSGSLFISPSCLVLSRFALRCLVRSCLVLSLFCLVLLCLVLSCLVLFCPVLFFSCFVLSCLVLSCFVLSCFSLVSSCPVLSCLVYSPSIHIFPSPPILLSSNLIHVDHKPQI